MARQDIGRRIADPLALAQELESADNDLNPHPSTSLVAPQSSNRSSRVLHPGLYPMSFPAPIVSVQSINISSSSSSPSSPSNPDPTLYAGLVHYRLGDASVSHSSHDARSEATESISPLTPNLPHMSAERTPRASISAQSVSSSVKNVSSHPSQGAGRPASSQIPSSHLRRHSTTTRDSSITLAASSSSSRSRAASGTDGEESEDPSSSTDPIARALLNRQRGRVMPDNASQHTFGHASRTHGYSASASQDAPRVSSSSVSITTSRSSSRASMRSAEQFSSDDEVEIGYYDGGSSPITFAKEYMVDIDEDVEPVDPGPSVLPPTLFDGRRGSLPMAIPGAVQGGDGIRSREESIRTVRMPRSWDDTSTHRSSLSGEDPTLILPKSEPLTRADWASLQAQAEAKQQQAVEAGDVYDGLNLQYILSKRSEGSIRSFGSGGSFVLGNRLSTSGLSIAPGSSLTLPIGDSFLRHLQKHDRMFNAQRYYWSFVREKADPSISSGSSRRRHAERSRGANPAKPIKEMSSRVQEMWRCGHVGRFKVDRLVIKPRSADPAKAPQQRIHIRNFADPYIKASTTGGPHSVIHKHSRAVAFSIFRSHGLFSSRKSGGDTQTHMNMRHGVMLAPKKVQEQYTSTKTTRQINTHGLLDDESRSHRDKDKDKDKDKDRGSRGSRRGTQSLSFRERDSREKEWRRAQDTENVKGKSKAASKGKDKSDKKHRGRPGESAESSTTTSSTGSVSNHTLQQVVSAPERPAMKIQFSPSMSSSTTAFKHESSSRPVSPTLSLPPSSIGDHSFKVAESDTSSIPPIRHHRDHRDSLDSDDRLPTRTPHAEAFGTLDPNDIEHYRAKANNRSTTDSSAGLAKRFLRAFRSGLRSDGPSASISSQPGAYQPPWMVTSGRDQQEEHDRVLNDLNDSFREVGLLHTNPHKSSRPYAKRKSKDGILDQIPDDCLYMLLPLWAGETDTASVHAESSSNASYVMPEKRQYLLVYYVPGNEPTDPKGKKPEKKKAKQSHSSDSGIEGDLKAIYLPTFHVVARVITYDDLRFSGVRLPSSGLAINGPEWEAISYPVSTPREKMPDTVICLCEGRERGFDFLEDGLHDLGLCAKEDLPIQNPPVSAAIAPFASEEEERESNMVLTPIGRAAIEMIWLGCLAITSFGPSQP